MKRNKAFSYLGALSLSMSLLSSFAFTENASATVQKEVTSSWLTVRTGPSPSAKAVDWIKKGTDVNVLSTSSGWDYVQYESGKKGYVYDGFLKTVASPISTSSKQYLVLPANAPTWTVYYANKPPVKVAGNIAGVLAPSKYGGLKYEILGKGSEPNTYIIQTDSFGKVKIYATTAIGASFIGTSNSAPAPAPVPTQSTTKAQIHLPASAATWTVYKMGYPLLKANAANVAGVLKPSKFGGLTYDILGTVGPNSFVIQTGDYGKVEIYGGPETGAQITGSLTNVPTSSTPTPAPAPAPASGSLSGKVIVIDPGHGGPDPGAQGYADEHKVVYDIAVKVQSKLQAEGAKVLLTRTATTSCNNGTYYQELACRPAIATQNHADLFVSIHANSATDSTASGTESWYYNSNRGDQKLATDIVNEVANYTSVKNRGVKENSWTVLVTSTVPSTLLETGFVTNPSDASKLNSSDYQDKYAQGVVQGIKDYLLR